MNIWDNHCRACLAVKESFTYYLNDNVSAETYRFCTSIQVMSEEGLPTSICDDCYELLLKFSDFKTKCMQSHKALTDTIVEKTTVQIKMEPIDDVNSIKEENEQEYFDISVFCETQALEEEETIKKRTRTRQKTKVENRFNYSCHLCYKKFGFCDRYEAHMLEHEGKVIPICCSLCNKTFKSWPNLKRHKATQHTVVKLDSYQCNTCGKILKSKDTLRLHETTHGERSTCVCVVCGQGCATKVILKSHMETHRENREKTFACEHCGNKFFNRALLKSHISKRHTGKQYICDICNFPFTDKFNLVKHLYKHEGKKLYKCDICLKSFSTHTSLLQHKRTHSGERPYLCNYCPKGFSSGSMLNDHRRIHTGERPHKCAVCEQAFTQRGTLKRHMKTHERI